jgi:hypothetical protein
LPSKLYEEIVFEVVQQQNFRMRERIYIQQVLVKDGYLGVAESAVD